MGNNRIVSVAIPAYKTKFLAQAIQSVIDQTYVNLEIIVVNDKSPEDIDGVVNQFSDNRIKYFVNEENLGGKNPALNWNKCLSYAKGEFFALLCDDDVYEPDFIQCMLELADKYPATNVFRSRVKYIDANCKEIDRCASSPEWESWEDYLWHVCHKYRTQTISEWMYRKYVLDKESGYALLPLAWYADYLSVFRFAKNGGIASSSSILVHFRQSGDNISSQDDKNTLQKIEATNMYREAVCNLLDKNDDKNNLVDSLDKLLKQHIRYNLNHAPKRVLLELYINRTHYKINISKIWRALWH